MSTSWDSSTGSTIHFDRHYLLCCHNNKSPTRLTQLLSSMATMSAGYSHDNGSFIRKVESCRHHPLPAWPRDLI